MTAEIAVINKSAIALAADSAVTISTPRGVKIYNTVNKLFALSKTQPVAAMIYGGASLISIPWEPLIKRYRSQLGSKFFQTLEEYANDFFEYFDNNVGILPADAQDQFAADRIAGVWLKIRQNIDRSVEAKLRESGGVLSEDEIKNITDRLVSEELEVLKQFKFIDGYDENTSAEFIKKASPFLVKLKGEIFEKLPMKPSTAKKLRLVAGYNLSREAFDKNYSGIVIAGYGTNDIFPRLASFLVDGAFNGKLRVKKMGVDRVGVNRPASILSFAQSDMISTFMEGVNPDYRDLIDQYVDVLFSQVSSVVVQSLNTHSLSPDVVVAVKKDIDKTMRAAANKAIHTLADFRQEVHVDPITQAVGILPKEELASMAESLVHLTSLKRRVSMDEETVGGPIDVAVISRGDGMVWIKRKHYFDPHLNHHFFANYFLDATGDNDHE